jgi:hypothetical protein
MSASIINSAEYLEIFSQEAPYLFANPALCAIVHTGPFRRLESLNFFSSTMISTAFPAEINVSDEAATRCFIVHEPETP